MTTQESERPDVGEAAPIAESVCVLFDSATGAVHHIRRTVTLTGGEVSSQQAVEERARGLAAQAGRYAGSLEALHLEPSALQRAARYRVDLETRQLCVMELPSGV